MITKAVFELLSEANAKETKKDVVAALQALPPTCKDIVRLALKQDVQFLLPEGHIEYPEPKDKDDFSKTPLLHQNVRKLYMFTDDPTVVGMTEEKRIRLFVNMISDLHPGDVDLLMQVKDKKLPYEKITAKVAKEAWPDF